MRDYIEIGPSPCDEPCVQVGEEDYTARAREECRKFMWAIRKKLGEEPDGANLRIRSNPHDFGSYLEVVCYFEDDNEEARNYAYACESDAPTTWEDTSPHNRQYQTLWEETAP